MNANVVMKLESHIDVDRSDTAVNLLAAHTKLSKVEIKRAMRAGAVWWGRTLDARKSRLRRATRQLAAGEQLAIYYNRALLHAAVPTPKLLADIDAYSVWFKPRGVACSGTRYGDHHSLPRLVAGIQERPVFLVHRLDRFTEGVILLAHSRGTARALSALFEQRRVHKVYHARVAGRFAAARRIDEPLDGKEAVSEVAPLKLDDHSTLVQVRIYSGRKHQIRRHLAQIGHPLVGDALHGDAQTPDLQLAAMSLAFTCPVRERPVNYVVPADAVQPSLSGSG